MIFNMMDANSGSDTTHLFGAPFSFAIVLSEILRFTDSYYPFWYLQTFLALFCERVILCTWNMCLYIKRYNSQQFISLMLNKNIAQHSNIDKNNTMSQFSRDIMSQSGQYIMFQSGR